MHVQLIFNEPYLNFLCTMMHFQIIFVTYIYQYVSIFSLIITLNLVLLRLLFGLSVFD